MLTGKRMVFATEFQLGGTGQGLAHGFRELGWAVQEVDYRQFFPVQTSRAARMLIKPLQPMFRAAYNEGILAVAKMDQPEVFVTVKGSHIDAATLKALSSRGIRTVNYYPDYHFEYPGLDQDLLDAYDFFITSKSFQCEYLSKRLGAERVAFVHHGYCDLVHRPSLDRIQPVTDVLYAGNYSVEKERLLGKLKRLLPDLNLRILGFRWNVATDEALRPNIHGHGLHGDNYARAIQLARINIALHGDKKEPEGWQDLVSTRTFEIPACKGFMLHIDNAEIRTLFEPGREIDTFVDVQDLAAKLKHYLSVPDQRAAMIERAYGRCVPTYGYSARAKQINALLAKPHSRSRQ